MHLLHLSSSKYAVSLRSIVSAGAKSGSRLQTQLAFKKKNKFLHWVTCWVLLYCVVSLSSSWYLVLVSTFHWKEGSLSFSLSLSLSLSLTHTHTHTRTHTQRTLLGYAVLCCEPCLFSYLAQSTSCYVVLVPSFHLSLSLSHTHTLTEGTSWYIVLVLSCQSLLEELSGLCYPLLWTSFVQSPSTDHIMRHSISLSISLKRMIKWHVSLFLSTFLSPLPPLPPSLSFIYI